MKQSHKVIIISHNNEKPALVVNTRVVDYLDALEVVLIAGRDNVMGADFIMSLTTGQIVKSRHKFGSFEFLKKVKEAWGFYEYYF